MKSKLAILAACIFSGLANAQAVLPTPNRFIDSPSWDYSPSWMADTVTGKDRVWWCSDRWSQYENEPQGEGDVIKYAENPSATGFPQIYQTVLTPSRDANGNFTSWEGPCVCDPSVVRGAFNFNGSSYGMVMYYTASQQCWTDNKIGVAFSNDGINWIKNPAPIISTNFSNNAIQRYGAGQPQARNVNGASGITLWHRDTPEQGPSNFYERYASDGINFGPATALSLNGIQRGITENASIALSPSAPYHLFLATAMPDLSLGIYKIPYEDRFSGTWQNIAIIPRTDGNDVFEPGFRTDIFGNLTNLSSPYHWIAAACGNYYSNSSPTEWHLCETFFPE